MFRSAQAIYNQLKNINGLKVFSEEIGGNSVVWLQFGIKNGGNYRIRFISKSDKNDVAVRVFAFISVEKDQIGKILPALNSLNSKYRFVKFVCEDDGNINIEYDFLWSCDAPEKSAEEIVIRIVQIVDDAYPEIMRALWT